MKASSVLSVAIAALFLQGSALAQVCDGPAGCSDIGAFTQLATELASNATLFKDTDLACGGQGSTFNVFLQAAANCAGDLATPNGCACQSETCMGASKTIAPECMAAMAGALCENAPWMEAKYSVSARNLFLHISNDCAELPATCDAPAFVCNGVPTAGPPAPVVEPAVQPEASPSPSSASRAASGAAALAALGFALLA